jgi:putative hydrolase of the HAD superfamily
LSFPQIDTRPLGTLFLDAGGVLMFPNWTRVSAALAARGVDVDPAVLAAAEPYAKKRLDTPATIAATTDSTRVFPYFNLVLDEAGVPQDAATDAALAELRAYHAEHNLWEHLPDDVRPALARFRHMGLTLVVVSNANGRNHVCFERVGLTACVDLALDSHVEGVEKPDPRLFRIALERSGSSAATTMHVGDIYHVDVVGARNASIEPVLLDPLGLYEGVDCPRVRSLGELADTLDSQRHRS